MLAGKSPFTPSSEMANYNYCGTKQWTARERQQFRRAWRVHRKQFQLLRSVVCQIIPFQICTVYSDGIVTECTSVQVSM